MKASSASRTLIVMALIGAGLWFVLSDDDPSQKAPEHKKSEPRVVTREWPEPAPADLIRLDLTGLDQNKLDDLTEKTLTLTDAQKFPDCHLILEPDGALEQSFPFADPATRALKLAGCDPEAYHVSDAGTRYLAYAVPAEGPGWDMRLAAYAPSSGSQANELQWHYRLDRSENAKNFTANFRRSFIAPLLPRLVCAGTLWEGGTQAACLDAETGQEKWTGMMKFWAGISPQPLANAMNAATLSGLTRRYPYSGVEMRFHRFEQNGGRSAYYATDGKRLFFVPREGSSESSESAEPDEVTMTAFDLSSFEPAWHLELPSQPQGSWEYASGELGVVLFKIDQTIYAASAASGEVVWGATIGEDEPPVAARGGKLYMLVRRETDPNLLFEIDPKSGQISWYAKAPTGTLEIEAIEDSLILRSVRAVQEVNGLE
jgi:outer membrane protein assembly factor BamB